MFEGLPIFHGIFSYLISMWEYYVEYCQSHKPLLWILLMLWSIWWGLNHPLILVRYTKIGIETSLFFIPFDIPCHGQNFPYIHTYIGTYSTSMNEESLNHVLLSPFRLGLCRNSYIGKVNQSNFDMKTWCYINTTSIWVMGNCSTSMEESSNLSSGRFTYLFYYNYLLVRMG